MRNIIVFIYALFLTGCSTNYYKKCSPQHNHPTKPYSLDKPTICKNEKKPSQDNTLKNSVDYYVKTCLKIETLLNNKSLKTIAIVKPFKHIAKIIEKDKIRSKGDELFKKLQTIKVNISDLNKIKGFISRKDTLCNKIIKEVNIYYEIIENAKIDYDLKMVELEDEQYKKYLNKLKYKPIENCAKYAQQLTDIYLELKSTNSNDFTKNDNYNFAKDNYNTCINNDKKN